MVLWFQLQCKAFRSSLFQLKSLVHFNNITVNVTNIHKNTSHWSTFGVDISFMNCHIETLHINVHGNANTQITRVYIAESQVGCMAIYDAVAILKSCNWENIITSKNKAACILVRNSKMTMKFSHVAHFKGTSFIQVTSGIANVTDANFVDCSSAGMLVHIRNQSVLGIENCTFASNDGHLFGLMHFSVGFMEKSVFLHNRMSDKMHVDLPLVQVATSVFVASHLQFVSNMVGTCVQIQNESVGVIHLSDFMNNTGSYASGIFAMQANLQVNKCTFVHNEQSGIHVKNSSCIIIASCLFHKNSAQHGGGMYVMSKTNQTSHSLTLDFLVRKANNFYPDTEIHQTVFGRYSLAKPVTLIHNCTFLENIAQDGGAIFQDNGSPFLTQRLDNNIGVKRAGSKQKYDSFGTEHDKLWILDSFFRKNKAFSYGGAILLSSQSTISKCTFTSNRAGAVGGAIYCTSVNISKCQFEMNSAHDGGAVDSYGSHAQISDTTFSHNTASDQGGALSVMFSSCFFCKFCNFHNNTAWAR